MSKEVDTFIKELGSAKFSPTYNVNDIINSVPLRQRSITQRRWLMSIVSLLITVGLAGGVAMAGAPLGNIIPKFIHIGSKQQTGTLLSVSYGNQPLWGGNIEQSTTYHDYATAISDVGVAIPKLNYPGLILNGIEVDSYSGSHVRVEATGLLRFPSSAFASEISLSAYKNLTQTIYLDGQSLTGPDVKVISIAGYGAKILSFRYRGKNSSLQHAYYLCWVQGKWTCVLSIAGDTSEYDLLAVARSIMG